MFRTTSRSILIFICIVGTTLILNGCEKAVGVPAVTPNGTTDETAFLYHVYLDFKQLNQIQEPGGATYSKQHLSDLRTSASRFALYAQDNKLDPNLQKLFNDEVAEIDARSDYCDAIAKIHSQVAARQAEDNSSTAADALTTGLGAASAMKGDGSDGSGLIAAVVVGGLQGISDANARQQALSNAEHDAIQQATEELNRVTSTVNAHSQDVSADLATRCHWDSDAGGNPVDRFKKTVDALTAQYMNAKTPDDAIAAARALFDAASIVPKGQIYDAYRCQAIFWAARSATWAAEQEMNGKKLGDYKASSAEYAVTLWDTCLTCDRQEEWKQMPVFRPLEYTPEIEQINSQKAWALAMEGKLSDAITVANSVFDQSNNDPDFHYKYACYSSCANHPDPEAAISSLRAALKSSSIYRVEAIADPNLEYLRKSNPNEFDDLVKVKFSWTVKWGAINDDVQMTNESAFPLQNIKLYLDIESNGNKWNPVLSADSILPGQSVTWENVFSIPGSTADVANGTLVCNETK